MPTLKELLEAKTQAQHKLPAVWQSKLSSTYGGFVKPLTGKDQGQIKAVREYLLSVDVEPVQAVGWCIENWQKFALDVRILEGLDHAPQQPVIGWVLKYKHRLAECYKLSLQSIAEPVVLKAEGVVVKHALPFVPGPQEQPAKFTPEEVAKNLEKF